MLLNLLRGLLAAACVLWAAPLAAAPRPFDVHDLVRMETLGRAAVSPDGRTLAFETFGPWETATRFDLGARAHWTTGRIRLVDRTGGPVRPLPGSVPTGQVLGDWSPSGRYLSLFAFRAGRWEAGVYDTVDVAVRWTGLSPELSFEGARPAWTADDRLLLPLRPDRPSAWSLRHDAFAREDTLARWSARDRGEASATALETRGGIAVPDAPRPRVEVRRVDPATGRSEVVAAGPIDDFAPSPSGRYLALVERGEGVAADDPLVQLAPTWRSRLRLVDLRSGADWRVWADRDVAANLLDWASGSDRLLAWARPDAGAWRDGDLWLVDAAARTAAPQLRGRLDPLGPDAFDLMTAVRATWMGEIPVVFAARPGQARRDWQAVRPDGVETLSARVPNPTPSLAGVAADGLMMVADGGVWRLRLGEGGRRLTPDDQVFARREARDPYAPQRQQLNAYPARDWAPVFDPSGGLWIVQADGARRRLTGQGGTAAWMSGTADWGVVTRRRDGVTRLSLEGPHEARILATANADLARVAFPRIVDVPHPDRLGRPASSRLFLPTDRPVERIRGVVVMTYPDSGATSGLYEPGVLFQGLNPLLPPGAGYAVLWAAMPDAPPLERAEAYARNIDIALDAAAAAVPGLPVDRTAVVGHSYGGYAALMVASATRRHRAYVSWAGPSEPAVMWGEFQGTERAALSDNLFLLYRAGWAETRQGGFGAPPWRTPEAYRAASPFYRADRFADPVLLITSDRDVVPMSAAEMMFSALHRQGKPARLVTYWGEGHWAFSPANLIDVDREIDAWLDRAFRTSTEDPRSASSRSATSSPSSPRP
ncbi:MULTISPECIES: prolyl oligopeptidase family serine peptidase [unclassified Brevundimonas]|nr:MULTISPECIES: prolyl oligopeptidase family serine peptidase [unclassified Brevundimonas]